MSTDYEITLKGVAGPTVRAALADLGLETRGANTVLRADLMDQAALHGVLDRLRDLGIEILEVRSAQPL